MRDDYFKILCEKATDYYALNQQFKFYHNYSHAADVLVTCGFLQPDHSPALDLAAIWHDAVYYPGIEENELASSIVLFNEAKKLGIEDDPIVQEAMFLIRNTTIKMHLSKRRIKGELAILLDADLSSLAVDYNQFVQNQDNILMENFVDQKDLLNRRWKSAKFLGQFLYIRKNIFHTAEGFKRYEQAAKKNIYEYCVEQYKLVPQLFDFSPDEMLLRRAFK